MLETHIGQPQVDDQPGLLVDTLGATSTQFSIQPRLLTAGFFMNGFKVCQIDTTTGPVPAYSRRDFYTISLLSGPRHLQRADQQIELNDTCLLLGNPPAAFSPAEATQQTGYSCRFTEAFFRQSGPVVSPEQWAIFKGHTPRTFALRDEQAAYLASLFQKMLAEQQTPYRYKDELLRNYLQLVMHEALRLRTPAPKRLFQYYFQQPGSVGELAAGWASRPQCPR